MIMKKAIFLLGILFVCGSALKAQLREITIKTTKDYHLKGDVKQVIKSHENYKKEIVSEKLVFTPEGYLQYEGWVNSPHGITYTYDRTGRLLTSKMVLDVDRFQVKTYAYNPQGLLIKYTRDTEQHEPYYETYQYVSNGVIQQRNMGKLCFEFRNTYDAQKRLVKTEQLLPSSKRVTSTTLITYLPNGWSKRVYTSHLQKTTTEFDHKGRIRSDVHCDQQSGEIYLSIVNKYDNNDNLVESRHNDVYTHYTYNDLGELSSEIYTGTEGGSTKKESYAYTKHDVKGNWTERIVTDLNTNKRYTETRDITYYE